MQTRINERIRVPQVRVIYGEHNAVLPTHKALEKAKQLGLDLIEVAPNARPPVCRITDYGKWKYDQSKQKKDNKAARTKEKEIKFRVNIDPHDYMIKMTRAEDFLAHGFKVRVQLQFRGRQNAHKELGFDLMNKAKEDLSGVSNCDLDPKLNNRNILMMLSPLPEQQRKRKFRVDYDEEEVDLDAHEAAEAEEDDHDDNDGHENENTSAEVTDDAAEEAEEEKED